MTTMHHSFWVRKAEQYRLQLEAARIGHQELLRQLDKSKANAANYAQRLAWEEKKSARLQQELNDLKPSKPMARLTLTTEWPDGTRTEI